MQRVSLFFREHSLLPVFSSHKKIRQQQQQSLSSSIYFFFFLCFSPYFLFYFKKAKQTIQKKNIKKSTTIFFIPLSFKKRRFTFSPPKNFQEMKKRHKYNQQHFCCGFLLLFAIFLLSFVFSLSLTKNKITDLFFLLLFLFSITIFF